MRALLVGAKLIDRGLEQLEAARPKNGAWCRLWCRITRSVTKNGRDDDSGDQGTVPHRTRSHFIPTTSDPGKTRNATSRALPAPGKFAL
jgi:hypothetical protein